MSIDVLHLSLHPMAGSVVLRYFTTSLSRYEGAISFVINVIKLQSQKESSTRS